MLPKTEKVSGAPPPSYPGHDEGGINDSEKVAYRPKGEPEDRQPIVQFH